MDYELAKQLKEAGFPIEGEGDSDSVFEVNGTWYKVPTLSELIEACDNPIGCIFSKEQSTAWQIGKPVAETKQEGKTPEEAVAKLWLATR